MFSISCAFHRSHVFLPFSLSSCLPTLTLATCFPKLSTGFMFSHTLHCLHVFPHLPLATCFPTLVTAGCKFSRATQWLYVSPRSCYNFKFLSLVNGCMFSLACRWLHIFPPLPMVSFFSLFLWTEYDVFSHYSRVTCFFALTGSGNIFLELVIGIVNQLSHTLTTYLSRFLDIYQSQGSYRSFHTIQTMMRMTSQLWTP